ncbi:MAG: hypothetical protein JSS98_00805 [Bacteroidetes bacterium]|nr:hypothetical protein [Bacteroidota bacterium]
MKRVHCFVLLFSYCIFLSCNLNEKISQYVSDKINKQERKKYLDIRKELELYLTHVQKCKTEYEIKSYIDSLPMMRENEIKSYGSEENWKKQLAWLKENGAKEITFATTTNSPPDSHF